jgi:hypothetical protein
MKTVILERFSKGRTEVVGLSEVVLVQNGLKQGDVVSSFLFLVVLYSKTLEMSKIAKLIAKHQILFSANNFDFSIRDPSGPRPLHC